MEEDIMNEENGKEITRWTCMLVRAGADEWGAPIFCVGRNADELSRKYSGCSPSGVQNVTELNGVKEDLLELGLEVEFRLTKPAATNVKWTRFDLTHQSDGMAGVYVDSTDFEALIIMQRLQRKELPSSFWMTAKPLPLGLIAQISHLGLPFGGHETVQTTLSDFFSIGLEPEEATKQHPPQLWMPGPSVPNSQGGK
jgi:hypothetical protein